MSGEPDYKERKFLVFESSLRQLFAVCQTCYSPCSVSLSTIGTLLTVHTSCPAGHKNRWDSQPYINGRPLGNLLITSFVLFTGASPTITLRLLRLMNIVVISMKTYTNYQRAILIPAVEQVIMMLSYEHYLTCFCIPMQCLTTLLAKVPSILLLSPTGVGGGAGEAVGRAP